MKWRKVEEGLMSESRLDKAIDTFFERLEGRRGEEFVEDVD